MERPDDQVWFLHEWFATQNMKQHDLVKRLDWLPAKANKIWHGIQPFRREEIVEVASLLNITHAELMMHPDDAMALRRLRQVVAEAVKPSPAPSPAPAEREEPSISTKRRAASRG